MQGTASRSLPGWTGRDDGPGDEHLRWHHVVQRWDGTAEPGACAFVGFRSDEGVRRNKGRRGAARGPEALRGALASMALPFPQRAFDAGDVEVTDGDLESGQRELGRVVTGLLDAGHLPVVFGGGHEVAFGSYLGLVNSKPVARGALIGVLNLDAHFDLRADPVPSSGTPFRQMAERERARGADFRYAVLGISQPSNTAGLFATADSLGVRHLTDDRCGVIDRPLVDGFLDDFLNRCDLVHLTIDLDVLPASAAPGVSAPAAFGVPVETVEHVCRRVVASGKLALCDVAELNPDLDIDSRTARTAARLVHRVLTEHTRNGERR
ncbi:formimidoylglutamase [Saccharopolyspora karakumensis]|uniref:Formimidoylglutamase n=1 Tax=Saccharopolyspora karakumensis TaxID=2530386 RepID=A0A4R5BWN0_9PSEU|nr:formimidoylglutamase [Saccharopolyspora karakumensis]TDD90073.1 formimidoylglutamase [Saccharopolyspora karakumensis]